MSQLFLFILLNIVIISFLFFVKRKRRTTLNLKRLIPIFFILLLVLILPDKIELKLLKYSICSTIFYMVGFAKLGVLEESSKHYLLYIIVVLTLIFIIEISFIAKLFSINGKRAVFAIFYAIITLLLEAYILLKFKEHFKEVIFDFTDNAVQFGMWLFSSILFCAQIITIVIISVYNIYVVYLAFVLFTSSHLFFVYVEYMNTFPIIREAIPYKYNVLEEEAESDVLEEEGIIYELEILEKIITLFDKDDCYKDPKITIADIAYKIGTNRTYLSRALNNRVAKNFNQFLNYYRVKTISQAYLETNDFKMANVYEQYGFSSFSSFNNAFKAYMGYTPAEWIKEVKARQDNDELIDLKDYLI